MEEKESGEESREINKSAAVETMVSGLSVWRTRWSKLKSGDRIAKDLMEDGNPPDTRERCRENLPRLRARVRLCGSPYVASSTRDPTRSDAKGASGQGALALGSSPEIGMLVSMWRWRRWRRGRWGSAAKRRHMASIPSGLPLASPKQALVPRRYPLLPRLHSYSRLEDLRTGGAAPVGRVSPARVGPASVRTGSAGVIRLLGGEQ